MILLSIFVLIFILLNTAPAILVMVDWLGSYVCVFNVTYLLNIEMVDNKTNRIPAIALRDVNSLNDVQVIDNMTWSEIFTKLVILLFAVSSCLSFNMFILALCCTYKCKWLRKCTRPRNVKVSQSNAEPLEAFYMTKDELLTRLNECQKEQIKEQLKEKLKELQQSCPQDLHVQQLKQQIKQQLQKLLKMQQLLEDQPHVQQVLEELERPQENRDKLLLSLKKVLEIIIYDQTTSTTLHLPESLYFILLWLLNIGLWGTGVGLFVTWHYNRHPYYTSTSNLSYEVEATGFGAYMYSLFCTIASCFIFSKLAYSVSERCLKLGNCIEVELTNDDKVDYASLMEADDNFTQQAQVTLVHWVFYTVTSYLSITLFLNMLMRYIQADLNTPPDSAIGFSDKELWVTGIFTLSHCLLFLYPCFKAATVTLSRETMIKKVGKHLQKVDNSGKIEQIFIQYLKNKKYGFRISFFCARLRFSFNVAYISIFIGLLGVLTKITGVL